jgi:hypothetical protein
MRSLLLSASILVGLSGASFAQLYRSGVPPGANSETGARPGNPIGTRDSLPHGNGASNTNESDVRALQNSAQSPDPTSG